MTDIRSTYSPELADFLSQHAEHVAEAAWMAATSTLERAAELAREGQFGRFRLHPRGELRRLRHHVAEGLALARLAVLLQLEENARYSDLTRDLHEAAVSAATARRRAQTLPAERARLENARQRRSAAL